MKIAQTPEGQTVKAEAASPKQAICPRCGGRLSLRSRRVMGNDKKTYFWRHQGNMNRHCSARRQPVR
ncbi:MAG: hypothetical protein GY803_11315 [Chloroflexi bacterium]|nr:hypothetical protein [Chloroflexota bacterium]